MLKTSGEIKLTITPQGTKPDFIRYKNELFDLKEDPGQKHPIDDAETEERLIRQMVGLMQENEAPAEQYVRLGLQDYV